MQSGMSQLSGMRSSANLKLDSNEHLSVTDALHRSERPIAEFLRPEVQILAQQMRISFRSSHNAELMWCDANRITRSFVTGVSPSLAFPINE
jgi:hypothetical protein